MVVVAVIGILSAVAWPSYKQYVQRGNRPAAQQLMLEIASREQQYLLDARQYTATIGSGGLNIGNVRGAWRHAPLLHVECPMTDTATLFHQQVRARPRNGSTDRVPPVRHVCVVGGGTAGRARIAHTDGSASIATQQAIITTNASQSVSETPTASASRSGSHENRRTARLRRAGDRNSASSTPDCHGPRYRRSPDRR